MQLLLCHKLRIYLLFLCIQGVTGLEKLLLEGQFLFQDPVFVFQHATRRVDGMHHVLHASHVLLVVLQHALSHVQIQVHLSSISHLLQLGNAAVQLVPEGTKAGTGPHVFNQLVHLLALLALLVGEEGEYLRLVVLLFILVLVREEFVLDVVQLALQHLGLLEVVVDQELQLLLLSHCVDHVVHVPSALQALLGQFALFEDGVQPNEELVFVQPIKQVFVYEDASEHIRVVE